MDSPTALERKIDKPTELIEAGFAAAAEDIGDIRSELTSIRRIGENSDTVSGLRSTSVAKSEHPFVPGGNARTRRGAARERHRHSRPARNARGVKGK